MLTSFATEAASGRTGAAGTRPLRGDGTVTRSDVHKQHEQNVWLERAEVGGDLTMQVTFRLPMPAAAMRLTDLIELERQAGIAHAHRALGVSKTAVFVLNRIGLSRADRPAESRDIVSGQVVVRPERVARSVRSAQQAFTITGTGLTATGTAHASFVPASVFQRLRSKGRTGPRQAIRAGKRFELHPDPNDPVLGDHPSDHISAMAIIAGTEGVLTSLEPERRLVDLDATFHSYAEESDLALVLQVVDLGDDSVFGTVDQGGHLCAEISARFAPGAES